MEGGGAYPAPNFLITEKGFFIMVSPFANGVKVDSVELIIVLRAPFQFSCSISFFPLGSCIFLHDIEFWNFGIELRIGEEWGIRSAWLKTLHFSKFYTVFPG